MGAPVTLLLVVGLSGGEVRSGQLNATLNAQLDPTRVQLRMRRADGVPNLERVLETASALGPVAVITNPRPGHLTIRVALQPGRWVSRSFVFARGDPLAERNRTVALAIAAMVPEWRLPKPLPEPEPLPEPAPATMPPLVEAETFAVADGGQVSETSDRRRDPEPNEKPELTAQTDAASVDAGSAAALEPALADAGPPMIVDEVTPAPPSQGLSVELSGLAGFFPFAPGLQLGGDYCTEHLCGGLLLRGQRGDLLEAQATLWRAGAMAIVRAQTTLGWERLRGAVQLSAGPGLLLAQRREQSQNHWQLEGALEAEVSVRVFSAWWLFLRGGLAAVSGATPILVNEQKVAELPALSAQGALGLRLGP